MPGFGGLVISIHAPREGSDFGFPVGRKHQMISIHAPREGSDGAGMPGFGGLVISIHAPREGSDSSTCCMAVWYSSFLSTLPARGATGRSRGLWASPWSISIHAPREGSDVDGVVEPEVDRVISIHAPREGSDLIGFYRCSRPDLFLSTLPARGAT